MHPWGHAEQVRTTQRASVLCLCGAKGVRFCSHRRHGVQGARPAVQGVATQPAQGGVFLGLMMNANLLAPSSSVFYPRGTTGAGSS